MNAKINYEFEDKEMLLMNIKSLSNVIYMAILGAEVDGALIQNCLSGTMYHLIKLIDKLEEVEQETAA